MFAKPQLCPIFLSLFISLVSFSMENPESKANTNQGKRIPMVSVFMKSAGKNNNADTFSEKQRSTKTKRLEREDVFEGILIKDLEFALRTTAPEDALDIIEYLKDPSILDDADRFRFFVGEPGTCKTTLAKAIAYKLKIEARWNYKFINSTDVLRLGSKQSSRNQAAINLGNLLDSIIEEDKPTLLIIDEVNQLLENAENEHYDTNTTSTLLWTFLDSQNYNENFFFIGIANRLNKIPKPCKSRIMLRYIEFKEISDPVIKRDLFLNKLNNESTKLHSEVENAYIDTLIKDTPGIMGRDFHELALKARKLSWREDRTKKLKIVTNKHLKEAFDTYVIEKSKIEYDKIEQTDEERRHKENIANQNEHSQENKNIQIQFHNENLKEQAKSQLMHETHFTMQQEKQEREYVEQLFRRLVKETNGNTGHVYAQDKKIDNLSSLKTINDLLGNNSPFYKTYKEKLAEELSYLTNKQITIFETMMVDMLTQRTKLDKMISQTPGSCTIQ